MYARTRVSFRLCRGQGGSMHMFSAKHNLLGGYAFIGEGIPIGLGAAFQSKYRFVMQLVHAERLQAHMLLPTCVWESAHTLQRVQGGVCIRACAVGGRRVAACFS